MEYDESKERETFHGGRSQYLIDEDGWSVTHVDVNGQSVSVIVQRNLECAHTIWNSAKLGGGNITN